MFPGLVSVDSINSNILFSIGLTHVGYSDNNHWQWSDDTRVDYTNWNPGEPNHPDYEQCSAAYMKKNVTWNDVICTDDLDNFVCKYSPTITLSTDTFNTTKTITMTTNHVATTTTLTTTTSTTTTLTTSTDTANSNNGT